MNKKQFMFFSFAVVLALFCCEFAYAQREGSLGAIRRHKPELGLAWETWKSNKGKKYRDPLEEDDRYGK